MASTCPGGEGGCYEGFLGTLTLCLGLYLLPKVPSARTRFARVILTSFPTVTPSKRQGYQDLDEIRGEGRYEGQQQALRESILAVLEARGLSVGDAERSALEATDDPEVLRRRLTQAATSPTTVEVFTCE